MKTNQIALLAVAIIIIIACVGGIYILSDKNKDNSNRGVELSDSDYYPVTVSTTVAGIEYHQTFTKKPERVITVRPENLELLISFGLEDIVVGAFANDTYRTLDKDLQDEFDAFEKTPVGAVIPLELVLSLNPDFILGWASTFNSGGGLIGNIDMLNGYGINCFVTNRPSSSVEDYLKIIETVGIIFNTNEISAQKIAEWDIRLANIREKTANINESEKVTAIVIEDGAYDGAYYVYGSNFLTGDLITQAGGINAYDGSMDLLTPEKIVSLNPDVIFLMIWDIQKTDPDQAISEFKATPGFASMTDDVVAFPFQELYMGGILSETILDKMFEVMYPELA